MPTTCTAAHGSCHHVAVVPVGCSNASKLTVCRLPVATESCSSNTCLNHTTTTSTSTTAACHTTVVAASPSSNGRVSCRGKTKRRKLNQSAAGLVKLTKCHAGAATCLLGLATTAAGFLLGVGALRISSTTDSTHYLEKPCPILAEASVMVLTGIAAMLSSRRRFKLMIILSIVLSFVSSLFCFASFIYLVTDVNASLRRLRDCTFQRAGNVCQCFVSYSDGRRVFRFTAVESCAAVQDNLRELVFGVCILFGVGFIISCATMTISCYLLYTERKKAITERIRSSGDGCNDLTSITTQTHETSFEAPTIRYDSSCAGAATDVAVISSPQCTANNASVATQTPMYMMPVAQLVYEMNSSVNDYRPVNLLLGDRDEPPPPYSDTFI